MATPRLGLVVEDKPTELSCRLCAYMYMPQYVETYKGIDLNSITLYCSSFFIMQVENTSKDADYSLVVSVMSSPPIHEVYIDAHFHYTALKVN